MDFVDNSLQTDCAEDHSSIISKEKSKKGNYKKEYKKLNCRTHPLTTNLSNGASPICNYVALIQNNVIYMENDVTDGSCPTDYSGFSYYRSKNSSQDHVLLKDVAVSCSLLKLKSNQNILTSLIDKYLFKQIKNEYEGFSKYLQNFSKNYKRSSNVKILPKPVATEYINKDGNIYLKLRLKVVNSNGMKEENVIKKFITSFLKSWKFLFPLQQKTENKRGCHPRNSLCAHANKHEIL